MIILYPIADGGTPGPNGWTHTGSGDFYEDVDEGPDSPDADSVAFSNGGGGILGKSIFFTVKTDGASGVTSALLRIRVENTKPGENIALLANIHYDNINAPQFYGQRTTFPSGSVVELPLLPQVGIPVDYEDFIGLLIGGFLDPESNEFLPDPTFTIEGVELILYQDDEPSGGVSGSGGFFLSLCGFP